MKKINWLVVGVIGMIVLLFLIGGGMMMGGWGYHGYGMMGGWRYSPFGWIGMLFMWLISVGFVVLIALGVAWLARNLSNSTPPAPQSACPQCNQPVQKDWKNRPHCGQAL